MSVGVLVYKQTQNMHENEPECVVLRVESTSLAGLLLLWSRYVAYLYTL